MGLGVGAAVFYAGGAASADTGGPAAGGADTVGASSTVGPRSAEGARQRGAARRGVAAATAAAAAATSTSTAGTLTVNPMVNIIDGIIQGRLNATSARVSTLTYTALGLAGGFDSTVGESGGKISLGTVPVSPPTVPRTTDPQSFTILPYANWLDGGAKGTQTFSVRVSEVTALDSFLTGIPLVGLVAAPRLAPGLARRAEGWFPAAEDAESAASAPRAPRSEVSAEATPPA